MKKFKFLALALAAIAIVSCSKENIVGENGEPGAIGEPTYATFSFKTGAASSRAGEANETDGGTGTTDADAEKVIKTARLLIFSTSGIEALETNKLVTLTAGGTKFTEVVKAGNKKMYVIANETPAMKITLDALTAGVTTLTSFLGLKYDAGVTNGDDFTLALLHTKSADMGFPMSSPDDKIYDFKANVTKEQTEAAADAQNAFTLSLDYMLSKVVVQAEDAVLENTILKATNMKFSIRNIAKEGSCAKVRG